MIESYSTDRRSGGAAAVAGLVTILALSLHAGPATAQVVLTPVAISGTVAPAGGKYSAFSSPVINTSGQVAFNATLTGGSSSKGVFAGLPGSLQAAALQGNAAPAGGSYAGFGIPAIDAAGQVAFVAPLTGGSSADGIYVGVPGSLQTAALLGSPAPAGGNYSTFGTVVVNGLGQVAFHANLTGGSSSGGIFVGAPGSMQAAALQGSAAPTGGFYGSSFGDPVVNALGQVAFSATLTGGASTGGMFAGVPGSLQTIALQGGAAPSGGSYTGYGNNPEINGSGETAFYAPLSGSSASGVFVGPPGSVHAAALQGEAAPGGGTFGDFSQPVVNASGQVAFYSSSGGLFVGALGSLKAAALDGLLAPGGNGASFSNLYGGPFLDAAGQVATLATLTGTGVTAANNTGLYAGLPGALVKVVRTGDMVDEGNGSGLHTVNHIYVAYPSGGEDGQALCFIDSGLLVYQLTFTDGTSGIFTSTIPVPEPSSALLTFVGLFAAARFRKRVAC